MATQDAGFGGTNHRCLSLSLLRNDFSDILNWLKGVFRIQIL